MDFGKGYSVFIYDNFNGMCYHVQDFPLYSEGVCIRLFSKFGSKVLFFVPHILVQVYLGCRFELKLAILTQCG